MDPPALPANASNNAAGFWPRAVAWLVDAGLVSLPVFGVMSLLGFDRVDALASEWREMGATVGKTMAAAIDHGEAPRAMLQSWLSAEGPLRPVIKMFLADRYAALWPVVALFVLIGLLYWPIQEAGHHRATLGKRVLGLQALAVGGRQLSPRKAFHRHMVGSLSWLTLNIGHLLAANAPRHQALHDRIANTQVVWHDGAKRSVPAWGWLLVVVACTLPLLIAVKAAFSLSAAMQAALGI